MARYSRGQVAISWGGGLEGFFPWEVGLKLSTLAAAGVSEILTKDGVYRRHFECAAFRIREDGIRNAGARATERRVEAELLASDHGGVPGWDPGPNSLAR